MNADKVYALALDSLRFVLNSLDAGEEYKAAWLNKIVENPEAYTGSTLIPGVSPLAQLLHMAKLEIAGKKASPSLVRGVTNIYKSAASMNRAHLSGAWIDSEGRQCLCDGYRGIRLHSPVESIPPAKGGLDLNKIMQPCLNYTQTLALPSVSELRTSIALDKNSRSKKDRDRLPLRYDFGDGLPSVNANYLYDFLNIFDDCTQALWSGNLNSPLYFRGKAGEGIVLPVKKSAS